jgi:hypothetical protein
MSNRRLVDSEFESNRNYLNSHLAEVGDAVLEITAFAEDSTLIR